MRVAAHTGLVVSTCLSRLVMPSSRAMLPAPVLMPVIKSLIVSAGISVEPATNARC